jgi:hypothetical protein
MKSFCYSLLFVALSISCGPQHYLGVYREVVDKTTLASTYVRSPDPVQASPPKGEKLYVRCKFPPSEKPIGYHILLSVIYNDLTEEKIDYPVALRSGEISLNLTDTKFKKTQGFFAYQALLLDKDDNVIDKWEHQLWTKIIR